VVGSFLNLGAWRSLVAHLLWEQVVVGSNPAAPTNVNILARTAGFLLLGLSLNLASCRACEKPAARGDRASDASAASTSADPSVDRGAVTASLTSPFGTGRLARGGLIVAGVERASSTLQVGRLDALGRISHAHGVLSEVTASKDAQVRVFSGPGDGATVLWRGLRRGRFVRTLVQLGPDLSPVGESREVASTPCVTRDAVWTLEDQKVSAQPVEGAGFSIALPKGEDASLVCGASRAYAVLDQEDGASAVMLAKGSSETKLLFRERDFGEDEQRERAEFLAGDDLGFVRIGASGSVAVRELSSGTLRALRTLKTRVPKDDDVVAVEASSTTLVIAYTEESTSACSTQASEEERVSVKVMALVVDRRTHAESLVELAPGRCGHEVGPFFTGTLGERVTVAWGEHGSGIGHARAPLVAVARATLGATGSDAGGPAFERIETQADALIDAGCDGTTCDLVAVSMASPDEPARFRVLTAR
jgi:hypothetical protein